VIERCDEPDMILPRMLQSRDVQEEWPMQLKALCCHGFGVNGCGRRESDVIESVMNDMNALARNGEEAFNVVGSVCTNCDDLFLSRREMRHDHASVKHPGQIVLLRHSERRQIMNRTDARTGTLPDQTPVAWNVNNIQIQFAGQLWQNSLVPENIFQGRTIFFTDCNDLELFTMIGEE